MRSGSAASVRRTGRPRARLCWPRRWGQAAAVTDAALCMIGARQPSKQSCRLLLWAWLDDCGMLDWAVPLSARWPEPALEDYLAHLQGTYDKDDGP